MRKGVVRGRRHLLGERVRELRVAEALAQRNVVELGRLPRHRGAPQQLVGAPQQLVGLPLLGASRGRGRRGCGRGRGSPAVRQRRRLRTRTAMGGLGGGGLGGEGLGGD